MLAVLVIVIFRFTLELFSCDFMLLLHIEFSLNSRIRNFVHVLFPTVLTLQGRNRFARSVHSTCGETLCDPEQLQVHRLRDVQSSFLFFRL